MPAVALLFFFWRKQSFCISGVEHTQSILTATVLIYSKKKKTKIQFLFLRNNKKEETTIHFKIMYMYDPPTKGIFNTVEGWCQPQHSNLSFILIFVFFFLAEFQEAFNLFDNRGDGKIQLNQVRNKFNF